MPIEIRELHIRVAVEAKPGGAPQGRQGASGQAKGGGGDKDEIVAECVDQVLRIMQSKRDR